MNSAENKSIIIVLQACIINFFFLERISVLNIPYWKDFFPPSNFDFGEIQISCFVGSAFFPSRFLSLKLGFYLKLFGDCGGGHDFSFSFFPLATLSFLVSR